MAPQSRNRMKVSALLRAGQKVSKIANLVGLAQPLTPSRSAWTMAKVSTDGQAVVEKLLGIVTACGMSFEAVPRVLHIIPKCILSWFDYKIQPQ